MKKVKMISFVITFVMCLGCTNSIDDDMLVISGQIGWKNELYSILEDNKDQISESELSLLDFKLHNSVVLTVDDFFNKESLFPVYINNLYERFELMPFYFLETDTLTTHYKADYLVEMVNLLLEEDNHDIVELNWLHKNNKFSSIALFNKQSGELEYDNVLFNIISQNQKLLKGTLTRAETVPINPYAIGYDIVHCYSSDNTMIASAWINWYEYGKFYKSSPVYSQEDSSIIGYKYKYQHDRLICNFDEWRFNNATAISVVKECDDHCSGNTINFTYCIWVGPTIDKPNDPINQYPPTQNGIVDISTYSIYYGGFRTEGRVCNIYMQPSYIQYN